MSMSTYVDRCDFNRGDLVDGRYHVEKALGEGSFGKVYRVKGPDGRVFALKMLRLWEVTPEIRKPLMGRFEMEFRTGQIPSDYLVQSYDFGIVGGNPYIVMEYCGGGDLTNLLGTRGADVATIASQILLGLKDLHSNGKVHRDLKPENVLFKDNSVAALTDFGIAGDRNHRMTDTNIFGKPNQIFGTYAYMAPEQAKRSRGGATVLPTTDIWSFGVLLFQLLTGELPFGTLSSHNDLASYQKRASKGEWNRSLLSSSPNAMQWESVVGACLVSDYKNRAATVDQLLNMPVFKNRKNSSSSKKDSIVSVNFNDKGKYSPSPRPTRISGYLLHIMQGEDYGLKYSITDIFRGGCKEITIGRNLENVIPIRETYNIYVSRFHCTIRRNDDGKTWMIYDGCWDSERKVWNHSTNGTFVNSTQIQDSGYKLNVGDIITIGDTKIRFEEF